MSELYYDPWDFDIDLDPYPTYRRLRDGTRLGHDAGRDHVSERPTTPPSPPK